VPLRLVGSEMCIRDRPIVIVNIGETKADELATAKIEANTSLVLERLFID
jgi:hypothetical protein